jgi:cobalamin biosynthesis protein CobD/CbiB
MTGMVGCLSLVLDFGMLIAGVWALVKGSLPAGLLKTLLGEGDYRTDSRTARFFGSLLVVPFVVFILSVVWTATASEQAAIISSAIHFIVFLIVVLTVAMWARQIRNANKASK